MNRDSEVAAEILMWLLHVSNPGTDPTSGASFRDSAGAGLDAETAAIAAQFPSLSAENHPDDQFSSLELTWDVDDRDPMISPVESSPSDSHLFPTANLGELSAVQDYVYTLLRHRLRTEIEQNPPLFPWETEVQDYPVELSTEVGTSAYPVWAQQLAQLQAPMTLPTALVQHLLSQAQTAIQSPAKSGLQLVRMVQDLFPTETQSLEQLAGLVLMSPARSGGTTTILADQTVRSTLPDSYDAASLPQQMVVSLLTARQLLDWLTLTLTPSTPEIRREWHTSVGIVQISCQYEAIALTVEVNLPTGGQITLTSAAGGQAIGSQQRENAGTLGLTRSISELSQDCLLTISLDMEHQPTLCWAISLAGLTSSH